MKKIAICTAVAAICAAPMTAMAGADFYGQLRASLNSVDSDQPAPQAQDGLTMTDNTSLFGYKASSEGNGIKAFIHMQTGVSSTDTTGPAFGQRFFFGGLSGGFGKVAYGRMTNAYKFAGFAMDPFYNHMSVNATSDLSGGGATYGLSGATNGFTNNALQYTSNAIGPVKINVGLYLDDADTDEHGTNLGVEFNQKGIKAGVQLASNGTVVTVPGLVADGDALRIYGGYKASKFSVSASLETIDTSATTDATYMFVAGKFNVTDKTQLAATLGTVSADAGSSAAADEGTGITVGVFQTVAPKTQVFLSTSMVSLDTAGQAEPSVISLGAIHKF